MTHHKPEKHFDVNNLGTSLYFVTLTCPGMAFEPPVVSRLSAGKSPRVAGYVMIPVSAGQGHDEVEI